MKVKFLFFFIFFFLYNFQTMSKENRLYHHLSNGTFRNPEGSPIRSENIKWSYKIFNEEKKKLDLTLPENYSFSNKEVLQNFEN